MDKTLVDYVDEAEGRVTEQFKDKVNFLNLIRLWIDGFDEVQKTLLDIEGIKDIEESSGVQLDNIGNIIGQPRELTDISATGFFGFESDPGAQPFGSIDNDRGGLYYSLRDPESAVGVISLSDYLYKTFLRSKIVQNNAGGTPEEIIQVVKGIFNPSIVELFEGGSDPDEPAVFTLAIGRDWNDPEETVFPGLDETQIADRLIPKPVGVRIEYINIQVDPTLLAVNTMWEQASNNLYRVVNQEIFQNL
jgi:hypothetical protein